MKKIKHQLTENVKFFHKIVLFHQEEFLLLKRSENSKTRALMWDLPGGNAEWPEQAHSEMGLHKRDPAREVLEETDIELSASIFVFDKLNYFNTYFDANVQIYSIFCGWRVDLPDDFDRTNIKLSEEHIDSTWVKLKDLDKYDFGGKEFNDMFREIIKG